MKIGYRIIIAFVVFSAMLYFIGGTSLVQPCSQIRSCNSCWDWREIEIQSELCSDGDTCLASPEKQEHNSKIDVLLCACNMAQQNSFSDEDLNSDISREAQVFLGYFLDSETLCENPGNFLIKRQY